MCTFHLTSYCSVILDEIHTIGQQEGGAVWEQILLLSPCPVMYVTFAFN
jgi:superfamily II RNA helicase